MDPILKKFGDVTIQRLEKPKDPKETPQSEATIQEKIAKPAEVSEKEISSETLNLKRSFPDSQISIKKFKLESGSVTLEKKITKDEPVEVKKVLEKPVTSEDVEQKRKLSGDSENPFSDTEISDFESESDIESDVDAELNSVEPKEVPKEDSEDDSTSTSFLEKLVEEPFQEAETVPPKPLDSSVENEDYDFDIKEKLKEMGEISFQTVKKGEKPKKVEVSTENEVVVTPARKPGDDEGTSERKGLNLRRNIREVMDETKLDESTLAAQRQEMERLQRVQEQQRLLRDLQRQAAQERMQHKVISLLQGNNFSKPGPSSTRIGNTVLVKLPNGQTKPMTRLPKRPFDLMRVQRNATLGQMGAPPRNARGMVPIKRPGANLTPSVSIAPVSKRFIPPAPKPHSDSESEEDVKPPMRLMKPHHAPVQTIDISSDEDCIVVSEPEGDHGDDGEDDPSNSGMHTHDEFNQPDDQGRVVVNIGHPEDEPDIFVAPQISRIIKPHQIGGVRFLYDNVVESTIRFKNSSGFGCILAHSMGLGKTLQVVCFSDIFLRHTPAKTILCIMPINTLQNWLAEYNMWLPTEDGVTSSPLHVHGEVRARKFNLHVLNDSHKTLTARHKVIHAWKTGGGVLLIGYEQFRLLSLKKHPKSRRKPHLIQPGDDDKNKAMFDDVHEALVRPGPDLVICDEGHRIKNSHASISQALKNMSTKRRVVLTGYPLQNNLMEYWCMVDFVRPNYLGTKTEFCNMFERPIMNGQCIDSTEADIKLMRYRAHVLHSLLVGFVQRRSHTVLQTALPQKEEYVLLVRMTPFQRKLYETFMDVVIRADLTPNPLKAFAVCCKIWNHPDVMYYFLEKRKSKGDAIDIDLEEVAAPGVISEAPTKPKKAPARPRKSTAKNKNGAKPAASVTPYNSSSEVLNQAQTNSTDPANVPTMATSFSGIIPQQENNTEPMPISQNSTNSFPSTSQNLSECPQPTNQTPYAQEQQQQQQQQSPRFPLSLAEKSPLDEIANFDPIASFGQSDDFNISSQNESDKATNSFLNAFTTDASNSEKTFLENIGEPTPQSITSNLDFINSISDNSQYTPQGQSTNVMADNNAASSAPSHFDLGFDQGNYPNFWGQPNDDFNLHTDFFGNSQPAETFNPNFSNSNANQAWVKKEEAPSVASSVRSENSNDSKPKINIISDIKLPCVFTPPTSEKKIKILSDIKIEPKIEESNDDKLDIKQELKKLAIKDELKTESKLSVEEDKIGDKILSDAMSSTRPMISNLKEDTSIPYDWAVELLKDYVPGIIENSAKMEILFCIIRESLTLGDRILIFSQSLITLDLIEQFLQTNVIPGDTQKWARNASYYRLDGSTSALEREKLINEFNSNPKIHLFLVSTRAGSLGINLVGANRVVVLDASWNPCHDTQAVCRVYRYGQRKPCFVYRLVVDNCLEKKIYDRQINKQGMSDRVVDECNPDAHLTMKDVSTLCWDEKMEEAEEKDWSHVRDNYIDVVLQKVIEKHGRRFTKEPFQHESLLVDRKEKQLSQQEKRLAKKGYEREKQAARQPAYNLLAGGRNRPIASVRPMQQGNERPSRWIPAEHWQRQGMTAQEMTLPLDVVIPTNQPEKGNIVLKAGQKVLVLKSPKGVYMQLESGKIVAIKTAIKVKGKAEDNHDPTKMMRPHLPPMMRPNQPTQPVMPQKKIVRPFTPGVAKMNVRSIRQSVPNLVSRIQSLTKKDQISSKSRPFQTGMDAIKALQKDHEQFPSSSSDEEHAQSERRKQQNHLDIVLPNREKYPTAEDFGKRYSLLKKQVSIRRVGNPQAQQEPKSASALQRLEQTTTSVINDDMPFQETLDSITSSYKDDNIEDDVSMASSLEPKPSQIASDASEENSDEVTYVSEQPAPPQHYPPNAPQSNVKDGKNEAPSGDYGGYNYNYNYNMQPYHAPPPPPPPQGYVYPGQHPPPYDMMGYPPQPPPPQPPQYNYGYQGYHPPPQPHYAPPPPPPPQGNYDYTAAPPQPIYSGYHNPYPPQPYAPPPPQNMYPAPQAPATAPNYPEYPYNANNPAPATPFYPNT